MLMEPAKGNTAHINKLLKEQRRMNIRILVDYKVIQMLKSVWLSGSTFAVASGTLDRFRSVI